MQPNGGTPSDPRTGQARQPLDSDRRDRWSIGILLGPGPLDLGTTPGPPNPVLTGDAVTDGPADFVADPFLVRDGGRWLLFFEVMLRGIWRGVIGLAESADGFDWEYRGTVLREPFHLSYP